MNKIYQWNKKSILKHSVSIGGYNLCINFSQVDINSIWIIKKLRINGYLAYLAGGCVRDLLLGINPKDFDIVTNAKPLEIKRIFKNIRLIGKRFLLVHIFFPGSKVIEVSTFRSMIIQDSCYENYKQIVRIYEDILFNYDNIYGNIVDDSQKRDFTINSLYYDPMADEVIDDIGGLYDLKAGVVKIIGNSAMRFREDPVRIIRAIKFSSRLNFIIDKKTLIRMNENVNQIIYCSKERISRELVKVFNSGYSYKIIKMFYAIDPLVRDWFLGKNILLKHYKKNVFQSLDKVILRDVCADIGLVLSVMLSRDYLLLNFSVNCKKRWMDAVFIEWILFSRLVNRDLEKTKMILFALSFFMNKKIDIRVAYYIVNKFWFKEALLVYIVNIINEKPKHRDLNKWKALALKKNRLYKVKELNKSFKKMFVQRRKYYFLKSTI